LEIANLGLRGVRAGWLIGQRTIDDIGKTEMASGTKNLSLLNGLSS
jgi:hypothetical protein